MEEEQPRHSGRLDLNAGKEGGARWQRGLGREKEERNGKRIGRHEAMASIAH